MHSEETAMVKVLTVGQTPPPFHGQAISIERIITGKYKRLKNYHVRMAFSSNIEEIGQLKLFKMMHLIKIIFSIIYVRFRHRVKILHYPPAGPQRIPMYRDIVILLCTRWLFQRTIFFFHAGGISELYSQLPAWVKLLYRWAYFYPDLTVILSDQNPPDGEIFRTKKNIILGQGIKDIFPLSHNTENKENLVPVLLYAGILNESKGVLILLEACRMLRDNAFEFKMELMGSFISKEFEATVLSFISNNHLRDYVDIMGVLTGDAKWNTYAAADIFCFPSFYENETFGLVLLEAMQFELPVVSTDWRGIPSIIRDGHSGFIVPIKDGNALAEKIAFLLLNPELRIAMGKQGRQIYLDNYTVENFWKNLEDAFLSIV